MSKKSAKKKATETDIFRTLLLSKRKEIKTLLSRPKEGQKTLRLALAEIAIVAAEISRSKKKAQSFSLIAGFRGVPRLRADSSRPIRLLKFFGLYRTPPTAKRHADLIDHIVRSRWSKDEVWERVLQEGPKAIMAKAKPGPKKKPQNATRGERSKFKLL